MTLRQAVEQAARYAMAQYTRESFSQPTCADFATYVSGTWEGLLETQAGVETIAVDPTLINFLPTKVTPGDPEEVKVEATYTSNFLIDVMPGKTTISLSAKSETPLVGGC
jgi:hypothetical protein